MHEDPFTRTKLVMGRSAVESLADKRVCLFGLGGVGGAALEGLIRAGIGAIDLVDDDEVAVSNLNRQILSQRSLIGVPKVDAAEARIREINPDCRITKYKMFYLPEEAEKIPFAGFDYVIDCIDTVKAKIDIAARAQAAGVPVISAMGCGNRFDPTKLVVTDIFKTHTDPLAKVLRHELKKEGIRKLKVVYSEEPAIIPAYDEVYDDAHPLEDEYAGRRMPQGSTPFVPNAAGLLIASEVVRELTHFDPSYRTKGGKQDH